MTADSPDTPAAERRTAEQRGADAFIDLIGLTLRTGELSTSRGHKPHVRVTMTAGTLAGIDDLLARGEACGRPIGWTDLHHVRYWRDGGLTDLANGIPLCRRHHTTTHQPQWQLSYDHSTLTVTVTKTVG